MVAGVFGKGEQLNVRKVLILDGMLGDIEKGIKNKLDAFSQYKSQHQTAPMTRTLEKIEAMVRFRGSQSGSVFAESFQVIRLSNYPF